MGILQSTEFYQSYTSIIHMVLVYNVVETKHQKTLENFKLWRGIFGGHICSTMAAILNYSVVEGKGKLKLGAYFEVFYSLWLDNIFRALKFYHWVSLVLIGYPWITLNLKLLLDFEMFCSLWVDILRTLKVYYWLSLVTLENFKVCRCYHY